VETRRRFLAGGCAALGVVILTGRPPASAASGSAEPPPGDIGDHEWRERLSPEQYAVLRESGTEPAFSSPLLDELRPGIFACGGCDLVLFSSSTKFDSGTGWPSFWSPLEDAVETTEDRSFGMVRTAVHCSRCNGHLGHVFDDGPPPTGLRYCINGIALTFQTAPADADQP